MTATTAVTIATTTAAAQEKTVFEFNIDFNLNSLSPVTLRAATVTATRIAENVVLTLQKCVK